jgi:hypothetical protein
MLVAEIQELDEVKGLVVKGQQVGVISYGEVATAVSEVDLDESDIEELYAYLERQGVELVEDVDPAQATAPAAEAESDKRGKRRKGTALDLKPDMTTDSLQLFLKDIGKVRLLTAQEEVELAKRIERGDLDAKQKMVESNLRLVVSEPGPALPGPDPGGDAGPGARRREVRLSEGVQVLDVRDLVDPPGDRPRSGRQGPHDPHPGPRGREAEQDRPRGAQAGHRARP